MSGVSFSDDRQFVCAPIFRDVSRNGSRALSASALRAALAAALDDAQSKKTKTKLRKSRKDSIMGRRDVACRRRKQSDLCRRIVNKDVGRVHFNVSAWRAVGARVRAAMRGVAGASPRDRP